MTLLASFWIGAQHQSQTPVATAAERKTEPARPVVPQAPRLASDADARPAAAQPRISNADTEAKQKMKLRSDEQKPVKVASLAPPKRKVVTTPQEKPKHVQVENKKNVTKKREQSNDLASARGHKKIQEKGRSETAVKKNIGPAAHKLAAAKKKQQEQDVAETRLRKKFRDEEMRRITNGRGATDKAKA